MPQMRKCKNKQCGKYFEYNPSHPKKYCCQKCCQDAHNRMNNRKRKYHKYQPGPKPNPNRPYTPDTVYLIHKWHREGMDSKEIGDLLMRSVENVQAALEKPLTRGQEKTISEYLLPIKTSHRGTQGEK